jgi:hypothetical protein
LNNKVSVSYASLENGEKAGLSVIEITTIPHNSILQQRNKNIPNIDTEYKQDMVRMFSEVYQNYKNTTNGCHDISLELLWSTKPVKNQPYTASIAIHIIVRSIGSNNADIENTITSVMRTCKATLEFGKYGYREITYVELASHIKNISDESVNAIIKNENLENLQNSLMPYCFAFEKVPVTENDLSRICNTLINYPNCAVSFQIIPVSYGFEEISAIDSNVQMLDTLSKGIKDQSIGSISFALAEKHAENYKYYSRNKNNALFAFNVLVYGTKGAANSIATRVLAQVNNASELRVISLSADDVRKDDNFYPLPWAIHEVILGTDRNQALWNTGQNINAFYSLPYIITAEEASEFIRMPIGSDTVYAGLTVNASDKTSKTYAENIVGGGDITVGVLKSSSHNDTIGISLKDLTKHMLVVGTPGSGKTTFSVSLLDRLWKDHQIPFLIIEPAKSEYRALVQSIPDLQVFTPGKNFISPFLFNPFVPPKNVKLETYKSTLKTAFAAAVTMTTPLDKIFEETVNNCYSEFRWLDTYTSDDKGQVFNIADFIKCFEETFELIGYTGDAQNIGRAGLVRLQGLVNLFDNYSSIPIEDLLSKPTVIELAAIENNDQKSLIISLLLLSILAYVNSNYVGEGNLRNVILLEEAHVLLDANSSVGEGEANPSAIAQNLVKRMLAEIRSYGVGIVIADQSPRKVTTDVVALTDIKLAFRLVEATDRQILADSSNMNDNQKQRLAKLMPGEAFLFFGKLEEPEEIKTEDYRLANNIDISLSDERIKSLSTYWNTRKDKLRPYPECAYCRCCAEGCDYNKRILGREIARRIFSKNFKSASDDSKIVKDVFRQMETLIKQQLNDEQFDMRLFSCVELNLLRQIRYGTKIKISDATIKVTLTEVGGEK